MLQKQVLLYFFLFSVCTRLPAQNLIPDSSFEHYRNKPVGFSAINESKNWYAPTRGTTDYFCACNDKQLKQVNTPSNEFGYQKPIEGSCYAGFIAYGAGRDYKEYLQTKLSSALVSGQSYCLHFNFSLADYSMWQANKLGVVFSEREIRSKKTTSLKSNTVIYFLMDSVSKFDTTHWISACYYFTATEASNYFSLGGFEVDKPLYRKIKYDPRKKNRPKNFAYYYVDNISLYPVSDSINCNCSVKGKVFLKQKKQDIPVVEKTGLTLHEKPFILKTILFDVDHYTLLPSSYKELDSLVTYLKENKTLNLEIAGHTDSSGDEMHNQKLAEARATAVANFLIEQQIDKKRISHIGYGSKRPLYTNDTEEHKKSNRRVEITFK